MPKEPLIPTTDDKLNLFYPKFGNNVEEALTEMGLDPKMGADAKKQALAWPVSYTTQQDALEAAKAATKKHGDQNTLSHDAVQSVINQIRNNPKYTPDIQAMLGTTPTETLHPTAKAGADQPIIDSKLVAGHPDLKCLKHGHSQIKILSKRGSETEFSLLAVVTSPHYVDPRPNLLPTQPETRTYLMVYVDKDVEVGSYSAPVSVAVLAQP